MTPTPSFIPDLCRLPVVLAVLLLTQLMVLVYVLSQNSISAFDWQQLSLLSLYNQWISILSIAGLCLLRGQINNRVMPVATCLSLGWVAVVVLLANTVAQWVNEGQKLEQWSALWLLRDEIIYLVLAGVVLRYLYILRLWRIEQEATHSARLDALHARIRPHFLFNAMNTIAGLIGYAPREAEEAVEDLAVLMRANLSNRDTLSSWREELELSRAYCRIEQQRLGGRLQLSWRVEALPPAMELPTLVLQPLLENAIYHGIEKLPEGGEVDISADIVRNGREIQAMIIIENPCSIDLDNREKAPDRHNGVALENIRARLASIYRDAGTGELRASLLNEYRDGRYRVCLSLPLETGSGETID